MNKNALYIVVCWVIFGISSCVIDTTQYPPEPQITFQKTLAELSRNDAGVDTLFYVGLYFGLVDGDGDIGAVPIENPDTIILPPINCFIELYYRNEGEYIKDTLFKATDYTIPYLPNEGQDKTLIADVIIDLPYSLSSQLKFPYDTLFYRVQIMDRKKNRSNVIFSDTLIYQNL